MKKITKRMAFYCCIVLAAILISPIFSNKVQAKDLDKIHEYDITANVLSNGTVNMRYHIVWEVLDSTSEGPLEWVKIGIANKHVSNIRGLTTNIKSIKYYSDGGSFIKIDFKKKYNAGEIVEFEFEIVQDYIYEMNKNEEGKTVYKFTPGWFDDINVELLTLKWNNDKVDSYSPACHLEADGYLTWTTKLNKKAKFNISLTYPNSAFNFDSEKTITNSNDDALTVPLAILIAALALVMASISSAVNKYKSTANMAGTTKKKIKRTKVVYYPSCPSCSAPRVEGKENCEYCGRSMIQSEEVLEEKEIKELDSSLKSQKNNEGLHPFASIPNTFMRVHVSHVYVPTRHSGTYAHGSCACACACACAGGGRAGCSTKDFYNTGVKLRQLKLRKKA